MAIRDRAGDPNAGQVGSTPTVLPADPAPSSRAQGAAARAIADAEAALAHQNSAIAQLDLQVISAILNAHLKAVEGSEALSTLQHDIEAAVRTRSDLDTPAGARDFQRYLIGKLRDIREVVANTSLDDTSKSALMAAWTSLYDASRGERGVPGDGAPVTAAPKDAPTRGAGQPAAPSPEVPYDYLLDSLPLDDPALFSDDPPAPGITSPVMPQPPAAPGMPTLGGATLPGGGMAPVSLPGMGAPGGLPLPGLLRGADTEPELRGLDEGRDSRNPDRALSDERGDRDHGEGEEQNATASSPESPPPGPTTVTLPNGETVTAASPQLAAVIQAAAGGTPIADAFQQQGITIPRPGTAVTDPIDPARVAPGDIGIFTDRHALALGNGKALLDGQMQHISTVRGPSFLGWEHPPVPATATAPARTDTPTPTRPAAPPTATQ
ncbi:DUF4226 domain-containing protein [Mycobacterium shinjukuense]|uniref:Uncharacterized protein n=1 Tax=Mycobacterium shinjukuense TaxID=398694 RepID=A0A7I7MTS4_9MYCO|nr:DUF4226 domain-containing protein [Mycobacterium shinjukuense]MCV6986321.1 DUF4226 domain-containing protein [Mycobacterium shinjukuense]ORB62000.1 hypothetical protein BST45_19345 [Mycobacterium shinjukuense]BBX75651.1 hypothetical protein MSHI_35570 [Mycobacterium shinjukuense]